MKALGWDEETSSGKRLASASRGSIFPFSAPVCQSIHGASGWAGSKFSQASNDGEQIV